MADADDDQLRNTWYRSVRAKSRVWLAHIDRRVIEVTDLQKQMRVPVFETAEVLYHTFALLNWLAHIYFREEKHVKEAKHPKGKDMVSWLGSVTGWQAEAVEALWFCLRNPNMHTGRAWLFADYDRKSTSGYKLYAGLHPDLTFNPLRFQPEEFKPKPHEDGFFLSPSFHKPGGLQVDFYYPGVRRKLDDAVSMVTSSIRTANHDSLMGLKKVNMRLLPIMFAGDDEPGD